MDNFSELLKHELQNHLRIDLNSYGREPDRYGITVSIYWDYNLISCSEINFLDDK